MTKTAVITGCSTGLGLSCALLFSQNGYTVFATVRKLEDSKNLTEALQKEKVDENLVKFIVMDVASDESVTLGFKSIHEQTKKVDVLICNAGFFLILFLTLIFLK